MNKKVKMIEKINTWQLVDKPEDTGIINLKGLIDSNIKRINRLKSTKLV